MTTPDDDDLYDGEQDGPPTLNDTLRRFSYTLNPTLYTDEDSDVSELLWQQVLEQRALRGWLVVTNVILLALLVALVLLLT